MGATRPECMETTTKYRTVSVCLCYTNIHFRYSRCRVSCSSCVCVCVLMAQKCKNFVDLANLDSTLDYGFTLCAFVWWDAFFGWLFVVVGADRLADLLDFHFSVFRPTFRAQNDKAFAFALSVIPIYSFVLWIYSSYFFCSALLGVVSRTHTTVYYFCSFFATSLRIECHTLCSTLRHT